MENKTNKLVGLKIEIVKNSIRFITPEGEVYYKNFKNFLKVVDYACSNMRKPGSVFSFAPLDISKVSEEEKAILKEYNVTPEEMLKGNYPIVEADAVVGA